ncbi:hypothetical protein A0H81_12998 [Grifola frondosa]|uniref:Uncharacterized protein n=1 Tax=Grifola frondosa TaxID=5627 RepID=A0A1C7LQW4_GRIFR|nr:hypothetical protein A0H81_12998 [Grifola frondosa]
MTCILSALNGHVFLEILKHMDLPTLLVLKRTSRTADDHISHYLASKLRVLLTRSFTHPDLFRSLLRDADSIISGSTALAFLLPEYLGWTPNDLDIYTPYGAFDVVIAHLVGIQSFQRVPIAEHEHYENEGIEEIARVKNGSIYVDIIRSKTDSPLHPLPFFWMTAAMNALSADGICAPYPRITGDLCALVNPLFVTAGGDPVPHLAPLIDKYQHRGFTIRTQQRAWCHEPDHPDGSPGKHTGCCACAVRVFGDEFCLRASFYQYTRPIEDVISRRNMSVLWRRGGHPCDNRCVGFSGLTLLEVEDISTSYY